jgi:hypothetical protein
MVGGAGCNQIKCYTPPIDQTWCGETSPIGAPNFYPIYIPFFGCQCSGFRGQRPDDRKQMVKTGGCSTLTVLCFLFYVIWLLTPVVQFRLKRSVSGETNFSEQKRSKKLSLCVSSYRRIFIDPDCHSICFIMKILVPYFYSFSEVFKCARRRFNAGREIPSRVAAMP